MDKRAFILSTVGLAVIGGTFRAGAQSIEIPNPLELIEVLPDEGKFNLMRKGVSLLRDILAFHYDPSSLEKDFDKFQGYLARINDSRTMIVETIQKYNGDIKVPEKVLGSIDKLISELPAIGIVPGSPLATYLVRSYVQYNQSLAVVLSESESPCDCFPFGYIC